MLLAVLQTTYCDTFTSFVRDNEGAIFVRDVYQPRPSLLLNLVAGFITKGRAKFTVTVTVPSGKLQVLKCS
jgi:hypothetical protein